MERLKSQYSIIRYMPEKLRGEIINIGIMIHTPLEDNNNNIYYKIISPNNTKFKSLFINKNANELYKVHFDFLNFYLAKAMKNEDIFSNSNLFLHLQEVLPSQIMLSEPTFAFTQEPKSLLKSLLSTYIGDEYLISEDIKNINIRSYVKEKFDEKNLIDTKVKANAKIFPFPDKKLINFNVDFVYKNGVVNFMQTLPSKENLKNWFNKLYSFIDNYEDTNKDSIYKILIDSKSAVIEDEVFIEMLDFLKEKVSADRFQTIDIHSKDFVNLCLKIENEGKFIEEFQDELVV